MPVRRIVRNIATKVPAIARLVSHRDALMGELRKAEDRISGLENALSISEAGRKKTDFEAIALKERLEYVQAAQSEAEPALAALGTSVLNFHSSNQPPKAPYIYFGNLFPHEPQFNSGLFRALALHQRFDYDIAYDIRNPLPFPEASIRGFQSQDVFEHVQFDGVSRILDDIFHCLVPGGIFRMSLPDYNSPLLRSRSVFDCVGRVLYDAAMGGSVVGKMSGGLDVSFPEGGDAHLWFPTYNNVLELIIASQIRRCSTIKFHHYWINSVDYRCENFDQSIMPVQRTPPNDMRADGKPISIVVDFIK